MKTELYVSVDIETDGPIPVDNSMLSFGAAAFLPDGRQVGTFTRNLETLPGAQGATDTMEWWAKQPDAWEACRVNPYPPAAAMRAFVNWVEELSKAFDATPVCVCYPAGFDWTFLYWYMMHFVGKSPFSFQCLDMKSYAMRALNLPFRKTTKKNFPKKWIPKEDKHNHVALDDAIEQGRIFIEMLKH